MICNHFYNILRLFYVLLDFVFTTSENAQLLLVHTVYMSYLTSCRTPYDLKS